MKSLTKEQLERKRQLEKECRELQGRMTDAIAEFNLAQQAAWDKLATHFENYNEKVDEVKDLLGEVTSDIENYVAEKSEKWQDSDRGREVDEWLSSWRDAQCEIVDQECPDAIDDPFDDAPGAADELEALTEEPGVIS